MKRLIAMLTMGLVLCAHGQKAINNPANAKRFWELLGASNALDAGTMSTLTSKIGAETPAGAQAKVNILGGTVGTLTTTVAGKVNTAGGNIISGPQTYTGQVQATAQVMIDGGTLLDRNLALAETALASVNTWSIFDGHPIGRAAAHGSAGGGTATAYNVRTNNNNVGTWARIRLASHFIAAGGTGFSTLACNCPMAMALHGSIDAAAASATTKARLRWVVGATSNAATAPALADSPPLATKGYGVEFYWSDTNSRKEARLFHHNGTTLVYSATPIAFPTGFGTNDTFILASNGAGRIRLYYGPAAGGNIPVRATSVLELTGATTVGYWGEGLDTTTTAVFVAVNPAAPFTSSGDILATFIRGTVTLNSNL